MPGLDRENNFSGDNTTKEEAKRLISQGGLIIDGEKYTDPDSEFPDKAAFEVKIGKKEFLKVVIK